MYSDNALYVLFSLTLVFLLVVHLASPRLKRAFPPLPIWRGAFWYRWRSLPSKKALAFSPFTGIIFPHKLIIRAKSAWLCFLLHLLFMTSMVAWSQYQHSSRETHNCPHPAPPHWCGWTSQLEPTHYVTILGSIIFIVLRLVQTHMWYDGLALDVPEASAMVATIVASCVALFMQQTERGLVFGQSINTETSLALTNIARRFHGYVFTTSLVFTFWYHPTEGGIMHSSGFLLLILFLIQGSLMYTVTHLGVVWRNLLEFTVLPHSLLIEWTRSRPKNESWKMFLSGYLLTFLITHIHAFEIPNSIKICIFCAFIILLYFLFSRNLRAGWSTTVSIPIIYLVCVIFFYSMLYLPYVVIKLLGYWPESSLEGTIPSGLHPALVICGVVLLIASIILIALVGEAIEALLRSLAKKAGSPSTSVEAIFSDPSIKVHFKRDNLPKVSPEELRKHDKEFDCWLAIHGIVYDVTDFVKFHPGGVKTLLEHCGGDVSEAFDSINRNNGHPAVIKERMRLFACGVLCSANNHHPPEQYAQRLSSVSTSKF